MKKIFALAVSLLLVSVTLNAQTYFNLGYAQPTDVYTFGSMDPELVNSNAVFAGLSYNFGKESLIGLEPGIEVLYSFHNDKNEILTINSEAKSSFVGLRAPILLNVGLTLGNTLTLKAFVGPTLSYGLSCTTTSYVEGKEMYTVDFYDDNSYNRFNVAATAALAAEINHFRLKVAYDYGLTNISNTDSERSSLKENVLMLSLGFMF